MRRAAASSDACPLAAATRHPCVSGARDGYAPSVDPVSKTPTEPRDYAAISAMYGAALGTLALAARRGHVVPVTDEPLCNRDIIPLGVAAFALSKLVAKEKVETWVRQPFVDEQPTGERRPKGRGMRYAIGELLTCTRCLGAWSALALVALRLARPTESKVVTTVLATSAANDFLHAGFSLLTAEANVADRQQEREPEETRSSPTPAPDSEAEPPTPLPRRSARGH